MFKTLKEGVCKIVVRSFNTSYPNKYVLLFVEDVTKDFPILNGDDLLKGRSGLGKVGALVENGVDYLPEVIMRELDGFNTKGFFISRMGFKEI